MLGSLASAGLELRVLRLRSSVVKVVDDVGDVCDFLLAALGIARCNWCLSL